MRKSYHPNGHDNCRIPSFIIYIEDSREGTNAFSTTYDIYDFFEILDCALLGYFVVVSILDATLCDKVCQCLFSTDKTNHPRSN